VQHVADHPDTPALVLLSRISAAPRSWRTRAKWACSAASASRRSTPRRAKWSPKAAKELMLLPGWWYVITAESYLDYSSGAARCAGIGAAHHMPVLYIRGDKEPAHIYPAEDFAARLRWAVRGAHRERLRSFLWRPRAGRDGDRHRMAGARDAGHLMGKT